MPARFADVLLDSEIALPALPVSDGSPEWSVRVDPAGHEPQQRWDHHWRAPGGAPVLSCARDGDRYRLGAPGLATFLVDDERAEIVCTPWRDLPGATLEHLLIDQVLPRVLAHRGRLVIHAGCVAASRGAVAFLGDSGAGKSTLCAAFARAGDELVGDDGIVARPDADGGFEVLATYPGLRLFQEPLAALFGDRTTARPVAHTTRKRRVAGEEIRFDPTSGAQPLRAMFVLEEGPRIRCEPLEGAAAFTALVRASFQMHLGDDDRSRELFRSIGSLVEAVPVRRLIYPRELSRLAAVRDAVLNELAEAETQGA